MTKNEKKRKENAKHVFMPQDLNAGTAKSINFPQKSKQWFENEAFWNTFAPIMFDAERWAEAPAVAEAIIRIAGLTSGCSVLEAGCGPGRIAVELAAKGPDVTGVDIITSELNAAKESASAEGVSIEFLNEDLRKFKSRKKFDCAVNVYNSFGYCASIEEDLSIIKNIADSLKEGGFFIMECISRETAILHFTEGEWFERAGFTVLTEYAIEGAWEGLKNRWILIDKNGQRIEHEYTQRLYSAVELKRMLSAVGFKSIEIYGDYDFSPYNHKARTMVIIAKK